MTKPRCPKCGRDVHKAGRLFSITGATGTQRYQCRPCKWHGTQPIGLAAAQSIGICKDTSVKLHRKVSKGKVRRLVVTAAQNATPVNKPFFASLLAYCRVNKAQLVVIPYRYKNPTSLWSEEAEHDDWWAAELVPYLLDQRTILNDHLVLLADIKTQPTASAPLSGFQTLTGPMSAVIGHPKIELETVPTPQAKLPKILVTTGAVTQKNYIDSKQGKKAEHHHSFGAAVVEIVGQTFHLRQINAVVDGSFIDLDTEYDGDRVETGIPLEALVLGDSHVDFADPEVTRATFDGPGSIVGALRPKLLVWHDLCDFFSRNHHHKDEPFIAFAKHHAGADNVEEELDRTFAFVDKHTPEGTKNLFVPSNHPDALARWVKSADPKSDPENAIFWATTYAEMCKAAKMTESGASTIDPFVWWAKRKLKCARRTTFLERDESFLIKGIELGFHGDRGPNGVRGSRAGFSKIGTKVVIGHSHSPGIRDGVYQTGTNSRLRLGYNSGPSSWLHTDAAIYRNGKRSLLNIINGKWRA